MKKLPQRKPNRLAGFDYSHSGAYFVTICTKNRANLFSEIVIVGATVPGRPHNNCRQPDDCRPCIPIVKLTELGKIIETAISQNNRNGVKIDQYVIMPNHIHMIVVIGSEMGKRGETDDRGRSPLQMIIRNMKAYITKQIGFPFWQKSFHDHIIRNENEYCRIANYIRNNPSNWKGDCFYVGK